MSWLRFDVLMTLRRVSVGDREKWSIGQTKLIRCDHPYILTLNMLNCFKDYKRYIHIWNCQIWPTSMKLTPKQQYMSVLHSQYHACWCSGNFRSQSISRHGIDTQSRNIPSSASKELRLHHTTCGTPFILGPGSLIKNIFINVDFTVHGRPPYK